MYETDFFSVSDGFSGSEADGKTPSVHPEETTVCCDNPSSYRSFLISGMMPAVNFAADIYKQIDYRDNKHRFINFVRCKSVAWFVRHKTTHEIRVAANRCGLRWCPICIKTRKFVIQNSTRNWLKTAKKPKFITFTLLHSEDPLSNQIDRLYSCFRKIRLSRLWKKHISGGLWFFQVKQSKTDGLFHPHLHLICDGSFIPQDKLSALWLSITGDSKIVDVRAVKDPKKVSDYVSRYAAAPCRLEDFELDKALEIFDALAGRRICGTFGTGKTICLVPKKCTDSNDWEHCGSFWDLCGSVDFDNFAAAVVLSWRLKRPYDGVIPYLESIPPPESGHQVEEPYTKEQLLLTYF